MCTLIVIQTLTEKGMHLWIGANRDEALARASMVPKLSKNGKSAVFAPRDVQAGGTWLGLNEHGVVAAITNRYGLERRPTHRSRGLVVLDALEERSAESAADRIAATHPEAHNGFHLVIADREDVFLVWNDGVRLHRERLLPGAHVLTERSLGAGPTERPGWVMGALERLEEEGRLVEAELLALLRYRNEQNPMEGTCIRVPGGVYGTRSSTVIALESDDVRFLHAEGAPCLTPYVDLSGEARRVLKGLVF